MLIAHIQDIKELVLLANIKEKFDINPDIHLELNVLNHYSRSIPLKMTKSLFNWTQLEVVLEKNKNERIIFNFKYNENNSNNYNELDRNDIVSVEIKQFLDNDVKFDVTIPF